MANVPSDLFYTEEHEYLKAAGDNTYYVGITDYAQGELGDIVYVELPSVGDKFAHKDVFGTVEAVKAVSDLYSPVAGEVVEVNGSLANDPAVINSDPYGAGWMIKIRIESESELDTLLGPDEYAKQIGQ